MRMDWLLILALVLLSSCECCRINEFVKKINCYSDYTAVDWCALSDKYYTTDAAEMDSTTIELIIDEFPLEMATEFWRLLHNARCDFHEKSLPVRAEASIDVINSLDRTEAMFDTVFVHCVSQEYYMRLFPEVYDETMKPTIEELILELTDYKAK